MPLPKADHYTIQDIYALPDGQRAELIDGQIFDMTPPNRTHQKLVLKLSGKIDAYISQQGGFCEVYPAPFAVFLSADEKNYVEPDISVICDKTKLDDKGCNGAPDWIIEIVSPGSRRMDYNIKNGKYAEAGVREYWIVDPEKEQTTIYFYDEDPAPTIIPFKQPIPVGIYKNFTISILELLN